LSEVCVAKDKWEDNRMDRVYALLVGSVVSGWFRE